MLSGVKYRYKEQRCCKTGLRIMVVSTHTGAHLESFGRGAGQERQTQTDGQTQKTIRDRWADRDR